MCETYNVRIKKRENPGLYMTGFEAGLESAMELFRSLEGVVPRGAPFEGDFRDGVIAGIRAAAEGVRKSLASFKMTRELFEASGMPPRPENPDGPKGVISSHGHGPGDFDFPKPEN